MPQQQRRRPPWARRSVWNVVIVLAIVVVAGFAVAGYEINHLRTEVNSMHTQINNLSRGLGTLYQEVVNLAKAK
jgi:cell division protein FtsL